MRVVVDDYGVSSDQHFQIRKYHIGALVTSYYTGVRIHSRSKSNPIHFHRGKEPLSTALSLFL